LDGVSEGSALVHGALDRRFTEDDLRRLASRRGKFFFFDYTKPWPDLITEHGGGFGEMKSKDELTASVMHCKSALKKDGCLLFVNFQMEAAPGSEEFCLNEAMLSGAIEKAGLKIVEFRTATPREEDRNTSSVEKMVYGHARKMS
jgi:hypothetical protein